MRFDVVFKKLCPEAYTPKRGSELAVGCDLRVPKETIIFEGANRIRTGIALENPPNIEAHIRPRSSSLGRFRLHIEIGTIDPDYTGELYIQSYSVCETKLGRGSKIAQIVFLPRLDVCPTEVTRELKQTSRGDRGFGSTGDGL